MTDDGKARLRLGGRTRLLPLDEARAGEWLADLGKAAADAGCKRLAALAESGPTEDGGRLAAVLDLSPYLKTIALRRPDWLEQLFDIDARARIDAILGALAGIGEAETSETRLMTRLREAKLEAALLIALRDLFGEADGAETTADLSALAEGAVSAALVFCLRDLAARGKLELADPADPEAGCGLFILGMGKLGGHELNYSSDIDLIAFFEPERARLAEPEESVETFSRLVRRLIRIIGERTADGYVFRTDFRLRPDPAAMPLAIPVATAMTYYESSGRNWERAAMIKARPIAGDREAASAFLDEISPFVWRRYLDFAAIADIQAMKSRINTHRGFSDLGVAGHNLKLGRGGIREIEFFAQTQQLIAGGRAPELRLRRTEAALRALAVGGWTSEAIAEELIEAYWFLRRIEHAVQMVEDEQTHVLPEDERELLRVARLAGFADVATFSAALGERQRIVEANFGQLFSGNASEADEAAPMSSLFGGDEDPAVVAELAAMGFRRPADIARIVSGWGFGRYRATRSQAARDQLSRVLPSLLKAFAGAKDPDAGLAAFDRFLAGLPAGVQFFSLIASNPRILDLLAGIITSAPRLSETMAQRPHVFDALLDPAFYREIPSRQLMAGRLAGFLADAGGVEDVLGRLRVFAAEQRFLIGARLLSGAMDGEVAGAAFSNVAELVIGEALAAVEAAFVERHGTVAGGRIALLGMGRLGSREMTAGSDVDLILLYDHDGAAEESSGPKPLPVSVYYTRLTQRLIAALSAPMAEGVLYEVDFRLRPSGNKGPLATHIEAFRKYQRLEAWTWERMALCRSRPIAGDASLAREAEAAVREAVTEPRDQAALVSDVAGMRARIERDKPPAGPLDLKLRPGGLIDLEFIAQWAILSGRVGAELVGRPTRDVLDALEAKDGLPIGNSEVSLHSSTDLYTRIIQLTRLGPGGVSKVGDLPQGLAERIAHALDVGDPDAVETKVEEMAAAVRTSFERLLPLAPEQGIETIPPAKRVDGLDAVGE